MNASEEVVSTETVDDTKAEECATEQPKYPIEMLVDTFERMQSRTRVYNLDVPVSMIFGFVYDKRHKRNTTTYCYLIVGGRCVSTGIARLHPKDANLFDARHGRIIACRRALKDVSGSDRAIKNVLGKLLLGDNANTLG